MTTAIHDRRIAGDPAARPIGSNGRSRPAKHTLVSRATNACRSPVRKLRCRDAGHWGRPRRPRRDRRETQVREAIESCDAQGNGLRLEYYWQADRFAHRFLRVRHGEAGECWGESAESPNSEYWPLSPPVQQISLEDINGQPTVMGVGATGSGHWSFSVQAAGLLEEFQGFVFDIALKPSKPVESCGSRYKAANDALVVMPLDHVAGTLTAKENGGWRIWPRMEDRAAEKVVGRTGVSGTVRWAYFIGLKSSDVARP